MLDFLTIMCGIAALLGVALFILGWRGRRIDDHPWCRKCRFDLVGSWPGSGNCPECGADLAAVAAVGNGQRGRQPVLVWSGALLTLLAVALAGWIIYQRTPPINWYAYKLDSWLVRDLKSSQANRMEAALEELVKRDEQGGLSQTNRSALLDHIFDLVMPDYRSTDVAWAPVVERAWCDGTLAAERRLAYAKGMSDHYLSLDHIPHGFYEGDVIGFGFGYRPRFSYRSKVMEFEIRPISILLDDREYEVFPTATSFVIEPEQRMYTTGRLQWEIPIEAAAGESVLHLTRELVCTLDGDSNRSVSWEARTDQPLTIQPPVWQSFSIVSHRAMGEKIRSAVHVTIAGFRHITPNNEFIGLIGRIDVDEIDVRASFTVLIEDEDCTLFVTDAPVRLDAYGTAEFHILAPRGSEIDSLQLVLYASRPSPSGTTAVDQEDRRHDDRPLWFGSPIRLRVPVQAWFESIDREDFLARSVSTGFESSSPSDPDN